MKTNTITPQVRIFSGRKALEVTGVTTFTLAVLHGIGLYCIHVGIKLPVAGEYLRAIYDLLR
jgi:hypothetical protein